MAIGTGVDPDFFHGRTGFKGVAAGYAGNLRTVIIRMDSVFHQLNLLPP